MILRRAMLSILVALMFFLLRATDCASTKEVDLILQEPIEAACVKEIFKIEGTTVPKIVPPIQETEKIEIIVPETQLETQPTEVVEEQRQWQGQVLNARIGVVQGPSGKETYYNLPMDRVITIMRKRGYSEEEYPYWIRDDGVKMFGPYVMCAANFNLRPRGTIVESSLGTAIVCDTGGFAKKIPLSLTLQ